MLDALNGREHSMSKNVSDLDTSSLKASSVSIVTSLLLSKSDIGKCEI